MIILYSKNERIRIFRKPGHETLFADELSFLTTPIRYRCHFYRKSVSLWFTIRMAGYLLTSLISISKMVYSEWICFPWKE